MENNLVQFADIATMSHPSSELNLVNHQSRELSQHIVYYLLKADHIVVNGHRTGNGHTVSMRNLITKDKGFQDAISTLETCCKDLKARHEREIEAQVDTLDISDNGLYREYQESCHQLMDEDVRWGRLTVLLFFTSVLAKRLYKEGKTSTIESLVGWQTSFLNDVAAQWILEHGGWRAIKGAVSIDAAVHAAAKAANKKAMDRRPSWLTIAAVGVGAAAIVTALIR